MTNIDAVTDVNSRRVIIIAEMTSTSFSWFMFDAQKMSSFTVKLFLISSRWYEYIISLSAYNFTCKAVLYRMVQFKTRRFKRDVRVVLKYKYMYDMLLE